MKKVLIVILILIAILVLVLKGLGFLLESQFEMLLNSNPNRGYNITYRDFDLRTFFNGGTMDDVKIEPIYPSGRGIEGSVKQITIDGLIWTQLLLGKGLSLDELSFIKPVFNITKTKDTTLQPQGTGMQNMFGDILSRADLNTFSLQNGSVFMKDLETGDELGHVTNISIEATELITDSVHLKYIIPFELGNLKVFIDSANIALNGYTHLRFGDVQFNLQEQWLHLRNVSLGYDMGWVDVSRKIKVQKEVIEFELDELSIHALESSGRFYSHLDVVAQKVKVDGLDIRFHKNKNYNRPPDTYKPMFQGLIESIPFALYLDTVQIVNSDLTYTELGKQKSRTGKLEVNDINGYVLNVTNMKDQQERLKTAQAGLHAKFLSRADLDVLLTVPYNEKTFSMTIDLGKINTKYLNPTLVPLAGVAFSSGQIQRIHYALEAGPKTGQNKLIFDYKNLKLTVVGQDSQGYLKKDGLLSAIANVAIRPNNMPGDKKYSIAHYQTKRNVYRTPVNYFMSGLMEGTMHIVPGKTVRNFLLKKK